jgi:hypothetical protein
MRIALCLSGQPRTWRATRESLAAFFAGHEVEVFLHTWREGDPAELEALVAAYAPRAWRIEERPLFLAEKRALAAAYPSRPPLTLIDMLHSTAESLALAAEAAPACDLIVRARFDALFDGVWCGDAPAAGEILVPDDFPSPIGCNDQFAIGGPAEMEAYGALRGWFASVLPQARGNALQPEVLLRAYLEEVRGLRLERRALAMRLLRPADAGKSFAEVAADPLFHAAKHEAWEAFAQAHLPDLAPRLDFTHPSRTPLALDRALDAWVELRGPAAAHALFAAPWPQRLAAVDAFLAEQAGETAELDEAAYETLRLVCAALLQRMDRREPLSLESAVVHMLSDNIRDMRRAYPWLDLVPGAAQRLLQTAPPGGLLARAIAFKPPWSAQGRDIWRR